MNIIFFIANAAKWNQKQVHALAREHKRTGYTVRVIDVSKGYGAKQAQDGVELVHIPKWAQSKLGQRIWALVYFIFHKRAIVHLFGIQGAWIAPIIRVVHPFSKIVLHADAATKKDIAWRHKLYARFVHRLITNRTDSFVSKELGRDAVGMPALMQVARQEIDPSIMQVHGLQMQNYIIGYVNPNNWEDVRRLVAGWRAHLKKRLPGMRLAVVFTEDGDMQHVVFGHDIVMLGRITPYTERMLAYGARAIVTPRMIGYRYEILQGMSYGRYTIPLRDVVEQNPFRLKELADIYEQDGQLIEDMEDPAIAMSWGHMAHAVIQEKHNPEAVAHQYEDLYEEMLFIDKAIARIRV